MAAQPQSDPLFLQEITQQFLKLWQDQLAAMSMDGNLVSNWLESMQESQKMFKHGGANYSPWPFAVYDVDKDPAVSPGAGANPVAELVRRLRICEKRLDALEAGAGKKGAAADGKPASKPAKRKAAARRTK